MPQFMWSSVHFVAPIFCFHNGWIWVDFSSVVAQSCAMQRLQAGCGRTPWAHLHLSLCPSITLARVRGFSLRCILRLRPVTSCRASSGYRRGQSCTPLLCDGSKTRLSGARVQLPTLHCLLLFMHVQPLWRCPLLIRTWVARRHFMCTASWLMCFSALLCLGLHNAKWLFPPCVLHSVVIEEVLMATTVARAAAAVANMKISHFYPSLNKGVSFSFYTAALKMLWLWGRKKKEPAFLLNN